MGDYQRMSVQVVMIVALMMIVGCAATPGIQSTQEIALPTLLITDAPTPDALVTESPEAIVTVQPTRPPLTLRIWLPEPLAPLDNEDAADLFSEQISAFVSTNPDIQIDFRLKRSDEIGGVMSTLMSASAVAPGALPDLTLFRRADLVLAAESGLIEPLDRMISPALLSDIDAPLIQRAQVDDRLFGVPYAFEVQHLAVQPEFADRTWSFEDVLNLDLPFALPLHESGGFMEALSAQIAAEGGTFDADGALVMEAEALQAVFAFYERAVTNGVIDAAVLEYRTPLDYQLALARGEIALGVVSTRPYLRLSANGADLAVGLLPTSDGSPATVIETWNWTITTSDADQQAAATRFLAWMFEVERHALYTQSIFLLPTSNGSLARWQPADYVTFVQKLLTEGVIAPAANATTSRRLLTALLGVVSSDLTAAQAAESVIVPVGTE